MAEVSFKGEVCTEPTPSEGGEDRVAVTVCVHQYGANNAVYVRAVALTEAARDALRALSPGDTVSFMGRVLPDPKEPQKTDDSPADKTVAVRSVKKHPAVLRYI